MLSKIEKFNNIEDIYMHLHKYPELSSNEFMTTKFIEEYLQSINDKYEQYELIIHKLPSTGLIAILDMKHTSTIAFRTDIDALPIDEENTFSYTSCNKGVMHACGHDGHMSMLLKFITNIFEKNLKFNKNLMFIFQPSEELDGGAQIVLADKIFQSYNIEHIFGMHLWPELPSGQVGLKKRALMGTNLPFEIIIKGKSAHVCTPEHGIDSMQVVSELVQNINYLIAKFKSPFEPVVINIGKIEGGTAANIIIDKLILEGTIRAASNTMLENLREAVLNILKSLELKYSCTIKFTQKEIPYPVVYNNEQIMDKVIDIIKEEDIDYTILEFPTLACEDFGFYAKEYETGFFFLGTYDKEHSNMLHTNNFSFDISILNKGIQLYELLLGSFAN